ncbi:GTP cyclohydrolase II [Nocardia sp. NPDC050712]|uniref:GTP cyclohydrolase II n=1 Tax=Nocardia sp. NPDC050712 TaxID=3155518 RepID=UPI0033EA3811
MTTFMSKPGETEHRFSRKGRELRVQVIELDGGHGEQGFALVFGQVADDCLVRIHSRCLYGESLFSDDCDCGPELDKALDLIQKAGRGVLIYLEQEGRGLGLIAKARGYRYAERTGSDTFTSYEALGYPADPRTYTVAARGLHALGLRSVQLLTNNPAKVEALVGSGIAVTTVPLRTRALSKRARDYLEAKRRRRGHWIPGDFAPWAEEATVVLTPAVENRALTDTAVLAPVPCDAAWDADIAATPASTEPKRRMRFWKSSSQPQPQQREIAGDLRVR